MFVDSQSELWSAVSRVADDEGLSLYDLERTPFGLRVFVERLGLREEVPGAVASPGPILTLMHESVGSKQD